MLNLLLSGEQVYFESQQCAGEVARAPTVCFGVCLKSLKTFYSLIFMRKMISMKFGSFMLLNLTFFYTVTFNAIPKNVVLDRKDFMSLLVSFCE